MLRTEFQYYGDDSFYFLYVTDKIRIETDGSNGLVLELRGSYKQEPIDMNYFLNLPDDEAAYFQQSTVNPELEATIKAVQTLYSHLQKEYPDDKWLYK
ncbi:TPA: hypothetical protein JHJ51_000965 [Enterobacter cloacae]|jgi:hypothetical protein|uniref:hypothetical protein n=1 Tax=Enterobacter cloacae TaxID=550 RepID=UPI0030406CB8|nr:hypothetical protein [Enterobacter cloacae]EKX9063249.1 hypothetical protein [Enterobacter cloacae]HAV2025374.1 hypothetical protein [Enterobacter cloacae]